MTADTLGLPEYIAADEASRYLEGGDPERALTLLREIRLVRPEPSPDAIGEEFEIRRLRSYIRQAIEEIEVAYPGHALRTLRIAIGRAPFG